MWQKVKEIEYTRYWLNQERTKKELCKDLRELLYNCIEPGLEFVEELQQGCFVRISEVEW